MGRQPRPRHAAKAKAPPPPPKCYHVLQGILRACHSLGIPPTRHATTSATCLHCATTTVRQRASQGLGCMPPEACKHADRFRTGTPVPNPQSQSFSMASHESLVSKQRESYRRIQGPFGKGDGKVRGQKSGRIEEILVSLICVWQEG